MRGRQAFMEGLLAHGLDCIFGNPGTTENPLLDSLAGCPQIRYYTALHEGVAVGAASFYAQAAGKPALVNLHVAPGLGNAIGMIYGALKARSPIVVTAGQQDTRLRLREPLLSHDLAAMAAPVVKWSAEPQSADEIAPMLERAVKIASDPPSGPVFMALPVDLMEQETKVAPRACTALHRQPAAAPEGIQAAAELLLGSQAPGILIGDDFGSENALDALVKLAETIGAPVWQAGLRARLAFPNRHPNYRGRLPLDAGGIRNAVAAQDLLLLAGGAFFDELWHDPVWPVPNGVKVLELQNCAQRLAFSCPVDLGLVGGLAETLEAVHATLLASAGSAYGTGAKARNGTLAKEAQAMRKAAAARLKKLWEPRPMTPLRALHELAQALPEDAAIVDESITAAPALWDRFDFQRPGDYYGGRGGGIGQGLAGAIGVQIAHPERPVAAISGDGSAMYSIQALWTAAHHRLPILFVILSNREYRVLKHNMDIYRRRYDAQSNRPYPHMDLDEPALGFVEMAQGMGVDGVQIAEPEQIAPAARQALASGAPFLMDILISGKV